MKMRKRTLVLAIAAVLITAAGLSAQLAENSPAPAFTLKDLAGKTITLDALRGKVVVLNFWATWCPPCRAEIPDFIEFYKENKTKGLEIVGVSVDTNTASQVPGFVQQNKIPYPVAMFTSKIIDNYGPIDAIPTTFVIDKTGRVRRVQVGMMDKETLASVFAQLSAAK
jgi:cytochrome c biogenesis protein CcmG/thiol:disulfide interchange protein DsbE